MNILVKTASGHIVVRPDTTWERDNEDLYAPEFVESMSYTKVLFARISKPGRSVSAKFAERYYDGFGRGVLLYPDQLLDGSQEGFAAASCLDRTSFLPYPVLGKEGLKAEDAELIRNTIELATKFCYIRIGDILAIELAPMEHLCSRADGTFEYAEGNLNFKIIF